MSDLIFSTTALVGLCYFGIATAVARLMPVGATRSVIFAFINIAAVWLIFFTGTQSGARSMLLYVIFLSVFWVLLRVAQKRSRHLFLLGFVPPIAWLVFAKTTGLLFFVGLSYMLFRCAHVEWELSKRKINMMSFPDYMAHCFFVPTFLIGPISPYSYFESSFNAGSAYKKENATNCLLENPKRSRKGCGYFWSILTT